MRQMLKELLQGGGQEVDAEAGQKAAFPEGSSGSVPAAAVGLEAMPGTGTGGWDQDMDYLGNLLDYGLRLMGNPGAEPAGEGGAASQTTSRTETLGDAEVMGQTSVQKEAHPGGSISPWVAPAAGRKAMADTGTGTADAASTTTRVPDAQKGLRSGLYQGTRCLLELMAIVAGGELVFTLCCIGIWYSWKRRRSTSGQELEDGGCTSHPDSVSSSSSSGNGPDSPLKCSAKRTPEQPSTSKPLIAP